MAASVTTKRLGQYFTPDDVARTLVRWVVRRRDDQLLDPACGDGRFVAAHPNSVGVELAAELSELARCAAPSATVHAADFFSWALDTKERFDCAVGNPPFVRYQHFNGNTRQKALKLAARMGVELSGLSSSWAPFIIGAASLLKPGGRLAFVVPAEIGHAPYAAPLLEGLCAHFDDLRIVAVRDKLFPKLSEDVWLLFADGFGGRSDEIGLVRWQTAILSHCPPQPFHRVSLDDWRRHGRRLRKHLIAGSFLDRYTAWSRRPGIVRLGDVATVGIGYVTGANDFFHLRPSLARRFEIPASVLRPSIRKGDQLPPNDVRARHVRQWVEHDQPVLLLDLAGVAELPPPVARYLDTDPGHQARATYKCRNRDPWYVVPDVHVPDAFLTYMSGKDVLLVRNSARCVCTNSVHAVHVNGRISVSHLQQAWSHPLRVLSAELEGHPLGGGLLKLEPREASRVLVPTGKAAIGSSDIPIIEEITREARSWRHCEA